MLARQRLIRALAMVIMVGACDTTEPPAAPSRLEVVAGDTQTATVATALPVPPAVRVVSANGKAVSHIVVTFQLREGGQIARASGLTDNRGVAPAGVWTLGTSAGVQTLTATVEGIPELSLTARAMAGPL